MKSERSFLFPGVVLFMTLFSWISSCTHNADINNIPEICFERDVLPVFQNSCAIAGCHDGTGESDLRLTSFVQIKDAVEPGKPYSSEIYKAIISTFGENKMPPGQPLSLENRTLIRLWIEQGAALTTCPDTSGGLTDYVNPRACFSRDILPVINSRCATSGCHDQLTHREGFIFTNYNSIMTAVEPGDPSGSKLYEVIKFASGEDKMPPAGSPQLTKAEIDSIAAWINYGALNEYCGELCDTLNQVTYSGIIWPAVQSSCTGCHSGTSPSGGVSLINYSTISAAAANGSLVNSLRGVGVTRMPLGSSFSECRIRQFEIWVNNGYLNN